jgi:O-antigen/teichoic acid export membrane protein
MNDIRQRVLSGLGWTGTTRILEQLLQFGISVVLARLLSPEDFGLIGMVLVFTGFASTLSDMGLGTALVQKRDISNRHLNTVFWLNAAAGTGLAFLFGMAAPLIADFYTEPALRWLTSIIALEFLLGSLNVVQNALLHKNLNFRLKFWINGVSLAVSGTVALVLAFIGAGVWSLVARSITSTFIQVIVMWRLSPWRPSLSFDWSALRELMPFGGNLLGSNIVLYWGGNFDKLVIGRLLGSSALGIYNLADRLMRLALTNVTDITSSVMFPAFSAMQDKVDSVKQAYLRSTRLIALVTFPMMIILSVLAEPAILFLYGNKWREAVEIVQVLSFSGLAQSVYFTGGWIFLSQGRPDILFRWGIYTTLVRVLGVLIGAHWGIIGVAWAYALGSYIFICYPTWSSAVRLVNLSFGELLNNLAGTFCCALLMGILIWSTDRWLFYDQTSLIRLIVQVPFGVIAYGVIIRQFRLNVLSDLQNIIREMGVGRSRLLRWLLDVKSDDLA